MATESTPLRDRAPSSRSDATQGFRRNRLAGLAAFALVLIVVALWVSVSATHQARANASPQPVKVKQDSTLTPSGASPAPSPAATLEAKKLTCGTAKNEAGYIKLPNKKDDQYFYWFFESRSSPSTDPLVLWLTGGPGCSSIMALLVENGPCKVTEGLTTVLNPYSWNTEANVLWLDQPSGVGFSYGSAEDADRDEDNVQENIYWFLRGFLAKHPDLAGRPLFITGESYGGHYVPAAAHYIWLENKANASSVSAASGSAGAEANASANATAPLINLQGIAIGNGLVNPVVQFKHFLDMTDNAYNVTLLNETQLAAAKEAVPVCEAVLTACQSNASACLDMDATCGRLISALGSAHRNMFDVRLECFNDKDVTDCYNMTTITQYLNSAPVRTYLNVSKAAPAWQMCSASVEASFAADVGRDLSPYVTDLLNDDALRVLVYNGDADMMCSWYGAEAWTTQLEWKHRAEFNAAKERPFLVSVASDKDAKMATEAAGSLRAFGDRFTFLRVFNSGHMVPMDQPRVALEMLTRFIRGERL